jgi:hypothetical protein
MPQTQIQTQTENIIDTSVLEEMILWIKALTAIGVSPDAAANVTSKFFIAAFAGDEDEDEEYYEE